MARRFVVVRSPALPSILALGLLLFAIFGAWIGAAQLLYIHIYGPAPPAAAIPFFNDVLTTSRGWLLILAGGSIGFGFAALALCLSMISFPLMLDRDVGLIPAITASLRLSRECPIAVALWGLIVAATLVVASLPRLGRGEGGRRRPRSDQRNCPPTWRPRERRPGSQSPPSRPWRNGSTPWRKSGRGGLRASAELRRGRRPPHAEAFRTRLGLTLNEAKTSVKDARKASFDFLGYTLARNAIGRMAIGIWAQAPRRRAFSGSRPELATVANADELSRRKSASSGADARTRPTRGIVTPRARCQSTRREVWRFILVD